MSDSTSNSIDDDAAKKPATGDDQPTQQIIVHGTYIAGNVNTSGGDVISGDKVGGDKIGGNKKEGGGAAGSSSSAQTPGEQIPRTVVVRQMGEAFNMEELADLCYAVDVDFDDIAGSSKSAKARELYLYLERRGKVASLIAELKRQRPGMTWE